MSEGKRMTLGELFARREAEAKAAYAERVAYEATSEGQAEVAARRAHEARMMAADERFAAGNPLDEEAEDEDDEGEDED